MAATTINYRYLTPEQYYSAFTLGVFSCTLSVLGSSAIIYLIVKRAKWKASLFQRIVLGLSISDVVGTVATGVQPFCLPSQTNMYFARGNTTSCSVIGFVFMATMASYLYSCALSIFFLLTIRYGLKESRVAKIMEPWVHVIPWAIPILFGSLALALQAYNPSLVLGICMFGSYPADCHVNDEVQCIRGNYSIVVYLLFVPWNVCSGIAAFVGICSTWAVYLSVRQQTQRNQRYDFLRESRTSNLGDGTLSTQQKRLRSVARQAIFYTAAFMNTFVGSCFGSIMGFFFTENNARIQALGENRLVYVAVIFLYTLFPLQGLLNSLVYIRPTIVRWKDAHQDRTWRWALVQTLSGRTPPKTARTAHLTSRMPVRRLEASSTSENNDSAGVQQEVIHEES